MFDPMPDFLDAWWRRNQLDLCLLFLIGMGAALGFVIGTAGRKGRDDG